MVCRSRAGKGGCCGIGDRHCPGCRRVCAGRRAWSCCSCCSCSSQSTADRGVCKGRRTKRRGGRCSGGWRGEGDGRDGRDGKVTGKDAGRSDDTGQGGEGGRLGPAAHIGNVRHALFVAEAPRRVPPVSFRATRGGCARGRVRPDAGTAAVSCPTFPDLLLYGQLVGVSSSVCCRPAGRADVSRSRSRSTVVSATAAACVCAWICASVYTCSY